MGPLGSVASANSPSSRVQMSGSSPEFSLMYFSPLTLMLTLYRAISINLQGDGRVTTEIWMTGDVQSCVPDTYTFSLGKTLGFINGGRRTRVSSREWAELDIKSRPQVTAAISVWHDVGTIVLAARETADAGGIFANSFRAIFILSWSHCVYFRQVSGI